MKEAERQEALIRTTKEESKKDGGRGQQNDRLGNSRLLVHQRNFKINKQMKTTRSCLNQLCRSSEKQSKVYYNQAKAEPRKIHIN